MSGIERKDTQYLAQRVPPFSFRKYTVLAIIQVVPGILMVSILFSVIPLPVQRTCNWNYYFALPFVLQAELANAFF
jgi:hypothetical protein